ncbi:endospore germination permease [Paenibacillus filicis]|uniref:Endospore germination permease n=1 Tax=Paenibacillus filicis TaxID=669464 RepID=A0ABU9DHY4_9BACL
MAQQSMISNRQLLALVALATVGTSSLYAPAPLAHYAGRDAWYLVLIGGAAGLLNIGVFVWLNRLYPEHNLISICKQVLGRWVGGLLGFIFVLYLLDISSWVLREFAQFFIITLEPTIPITWYLAAGALMCGYAVYHGLEVFARVSEIVFILTVATFLGIYLLLLYQYQPEYMLPVLENGLLEPLKGVLVPISWVGDLMCVSMLLKHVRKTKQTGYYIVGTVGVIALILLLAVVTCTMVLGGEATATFTYPSISLIQNIHLFRNIERFDAALVAAWVMSAFIKITVYFWSALQGFTELLPIRQPRAFVAPLAVAMILCSKYKVWGLIEMASFYDKQSWYFIIFQFCLPALLLLAALGKSILTKHRDG